MGENVAHVVSFGAHMRKDHLGPSVRAAYSFASTPKKTLFPHDSCALQASARKWTSLAEDREISIQLIY
jgi:hypothetical protein